MDITPRELGFLNFYRASELHGGLILGQLARRARGSALVLDLTRHAAEEVVHAQLWTETIIAVGGQVRPVRETYQTRYARYVGTPMALVDVLALTQVFERRVYRHFTEHLHRPGDAPARARDARAHARGGEGAPALGEALARRAGRRHAARWWPTRCARYTAADALVYAEMTDELGWQEAA